MNRKTLKIIGLVAVAALLSSLLTGGLVYFLGNGQQQAGTSPHQQQGLYTLANSSDTQANQDALPVNFAEAAKRSTPAVVHIKSTKTQARSPQSREEMPEFFHHFFGPQQPFDRRQFRPRKRKATGSGVIINGQDGYIVTNHHVIESAEKVEVTLHDNRSFSAEVVGTDPSTDLALIQVNPDEELPYMKLGNSEKIEVGEWVLAVGNPFNLSSTVTAGIVSAKGRNLNLLRGKAEAPIESFIQTDAAVNPGNSGGALVDRHGHLIGINTAIASPTGTYAGYAFAVPVNLMKKIVEDLQKYGTVQRGYLGVMIQEVNSDLAKKKDLERLKGVYVAEMMENSAAKAAGIEPGDIITKVNGEPVSSVSKLQETIATHRPGDKVTVTVFRDGDTEKIEVTLKNRQGGTKVVKERKSEVLAKLGVRLKALSEAQKEKAGISNGVQVDKLLAGKVTQQTTMREGFIIRKVDGQEVDSIDDVLDALSGKKGGVMLEGVYPERDGVYYYAVGL